MELAIIYTVLWVIWGIIFLAIEVPALFRRERGDTLTDHVLWFKRWRVKGIPVGFIAFMSFWIWLTVHFVLEIW